jgi:hypothetical protein
MTTKSSFLGLMLVTAATVFASDIKTYIAPYETYINYDNSDIKKDGYSFTLYGSISLNEGTHILEFSYGNTHLNYKGNGTDWNQNDYAFAYTNYMLFPFYVKVGYHYIDTPNTDISDDANVYFADAGYVKRYNWNAGAGIYYSNYRNDIEVFQFTPHAGKYFWRDYYRGFYIGLNANWINLDKHEKLGLSKQNYYSAGLSVSYFTPKYSVGVKGWAGEAIFKVDKGGFIVYNLKEKYKGGAGLFGTYYFNKKINVSANFDYNTYKEVDTGRNVNTYVVTISLGYSF